MRYTTDHIARILGITTSLPGHPVDYLLLDSRKVQVPGLALFFALHGPRRDGHQFIPELYKAGVRSFVISQAIDKTAFPEAAFIEVTDVVTALQQLAAYHRSRFDIPVIGITGSNGKTIVKEWLYQCLQPDHTIVRSPKSYNSQIGVPLSVWQMDTWHQLGIFEAGISETGEMEKLEPVIRPTLGVLTNIGEAHSEGFTSQQQKLEEKLKLFTHCSIVLGREKDLAVYKDSLKNQANAPVVLTWGDTARSDLQVKAREQRNDHTWLRLCTGAHEMEYTIPFTDEASVENAITSIFVLLQLEVPPAMIAQRLLTLQPVDMRLELKKGINQCTLINDSYSADINSLQIALNFLDQQSGGTRKTVILSDLLQSARSDANLYADILDYLKQHNVSRLIGIGQHITRALQDATAPGMQIGLFESTHDFIQQFLSTQHKEETILIKGARVFGFEQIVALLEQKVHQTVLEINLNAIAHNVRVYQRQLKPSTRMMAMVKAFAYGSGGAEIAGILQYHKVDYLGVAYADEGAELRRSGILLPIMVMNPEETAFESIVEYNLEPDLYSPTMLQAFEKFLDHEGRQDYPVHIEIETGMNRLGFALSDVPALAERLQQSKRLRVQSVFSHLAASEDPAQDAYTLQQFERYQQAVAILTEKIGAGFIRHISNSAAIFRLPQLQLDMVRLGIGLYGIDSAQAHQAWLHPAAALKTTIAQIKQLSAEETVGYNRRGRLQRPSTIATVRIGYADGYSRRLGNGVGKMLVNGQLAPVIGSICMDMTMVDITGIVNVQEGDEVIVFGPGLPIQDMAAWAGTIPYEIMTGISQRVKRVYFEE